MILVGTRLDFMLPQFVGRVRFSRSALGGANLESGNPLNALRENRTSYLAEASGLQPVLTCRMRPFHPNVSYHTNHFSGGFRLDLDVPR